MRQEILEISIKSSTHVMALSLYNHECLASVKLFMDNG